MQSHMINVKDDKFNTAEELGISQKEHDGLVWTLGLLESNALQEGEVGNANAFNMACTAEKKGCGTVACIAGWTAIHMQRIKPNAAGIYVLDDSQLRAVDAYVGEDHPEPLDDLFYVSSPTHWIGSMAAVTTRQAAKALRNYLTPGIGEPRWHEVMEDAQLKPKHLRRAV